MFHGQFLTMETRMPRVEAVLIKDGNIEETGTLEELQALCPDAVLRDMGGAVILPGFIDGHSHLTAVADSMALADLKPEAEDGRGTMEEIREKLKKKLEEMEEDGTASPDTWVIGTGYDNSLLPGGAHPDRRLLDQVSENILWQPCMFPDISVRSIPEEWRFWDIPEKRFRCRKEERQTGMDS